MSDDRDRRPKPVPGPAPSVQVRPAADVRAARKARSDDEARAARDAGAGGGALAARDARAPGDAPVARDARTDGDARAARDARTDGDARVVRDARADGDARTDGDARAVRDARADGDARAVRDARPDAGERADGEARAARDTRPDHDARVGPDVRPDGDARVTRAADLRSDREVRSDGDVRPVRDMRGMVNARAGTDAGTATTTREAAAGGSDRPRFIPETAHVRALGGPARPALSSGPRFDSRAAFDPVQIRLDAKTCRDLTRASKKEWFLANGIGGFAMSTAAGLNTRRHHGLLVAQMRAPIGRAVILSKMDETLVLPGGALSLDTNFYPGVVHPRGFEHIEGFSLYPFPAVTFVGPGWRLEKTIDLVHGENTVVVSYRMLPASRPRRVGKRGKAGVATGDSGGGDDPSDGRGAQAADPTTNAATAGAVDPAHAAAARAVGPAASPDVNDDGTVAPLDRLLLRVRPLFAFRAAAALSEQNDRIDRSVVSREYEAHGSMARFAPYAEWDPVYLVCPQAPFVEQPDWYKSVEYPQERYRGLEFRDDLWTYGYYEHELRAGEALTIVCTLQPPDRRGPNWAPERSMERRGQVLLQSPEDKPFVRRLVLASEQFLVRRERDVGAVVAGYPWLNDSARDTLIGLPGLFLVSGRFREAKTLLRAYARSLERGLLPDRLPEPGTRPQFGTVDATLWFFVAVFKYLQYTGDFDFVKTELRIPMLETIRYYSEGSRYGIRVESDGLLRAGEPGMALTWMDATVDGQPVTQRAGKPVEVNALWYNALRIMERLAQRFSIPNDMARFGRMADKLEENFLPVYWNERARCLYDCVDVGGPDAAIRPNQLFAVSLPFPLLDSESAQSVVRVVTDKLLTPMGVRTLDADHPEFKGVYDGDPKQRDAALHQGTVWAWLLGPYISALVKANGAAARVDAAKLLKPFEQHLTEDGLGQISEIFWGQAPHWPRGCPVHMTAVAEILRVYCEDVLGRAPGQKASIGEPVLRNR